MLALLVVLVAVSMVEGEEMMPIKKSCKPIQVATDGIPNQPALCATPLCVLQVTAVTQRIQVIEGAL